MTIDAQVAKYRRAVAEPFAAVEKLDFELFLHHPGTGTVGELIADYDHHRQQIEAWQQGAAALLGSRVLLLCCWCHPLRPAFVFNNLRAGQQSEVAVSKSGDSRAVAPQAGRWPGTSAGGAERFVLGAYPAAPVDTDIGG